MSDMADLLEGLSPEKKELLALLLQEEEAVKKAKKITRLNRDKNQYPLSFAQQRLWFLDQFEPNSPFYNLPIAVRVRGNLDKQALQSSLDYLVTRHESLRTTFDSTDGKPVQILDPKMVVKIQEEDFNGGAVEARFSTAMTRAARIVSEPFDLTNGPLIRLVILNLGEGDAVIILIMHHIISDGWSLGILIEELFTLYEFFLTGNKHDLPDAEIQYIDFSSWQRDWLSGEKLKEQVNYWKSYLDGCPSLLDLPLDFQRPSIQRNRGGQLEFRISNDILPGLKSLCQAEGATLFMALLAAFNVLLSRYSSQKDIVIGTPIANRNRIELEKIIGFFANTIVIRTKIDGRPSFRELLRQVQTHTVSSYDHQDLPFEMLVDEIQPERDMSYTPIFQVMFVFQNIPANKKIIPGIKLELLPVHMGTSKFDLNLVLSEVDNDIFGTIEFNTDLFALETIEAMAGHYTEIVRWAGRFPDNFIGKIPFLSEDERVRLLSDWNDTQWKLPEEVNIVSLFEKQARLVPDRIAVLADTRNGMDEKVSYQELNDRSNRLARYLKSLGVKRDEVVGLYMERSVEMIIGLVGILKAGGAYLPLDPSYPEERLSYIIKDASDAIGRGLVVVTHHGLAAKLPGNAASIVMLDEEWELIQDRPGENLDEVIHETDLAYVIYTSGSTGRPKGVMIEHRNAINLWLGLRKEIYGSEEGSGERVSINAPLLFDASVQQWIMLLSGETLVIVPQEVRLDGEGLLEWVGKNDIDVLDCVPTQLKMLIGAGLLDDGMNKKPRAILPGGEAIDPTVWEKLVDGEAIEFFNMYGPTECTVDATICRIKGHPEKPSIGKGIINTKLFVLDDELELVPVGVGGELYIGGSGVGRGYLNRRELTDERFILSPFEKDDRLYRTGDRVRWLRTGQLEYLGRNDNQVKVRGFRIELGEIENVLNQHPQVKEAAVIVINKSDLLRNDTRIAAYYVINDIEKPAKKIEPVEIRRFLQDRLPDYMVPSHLIRLDALPLTPNGKLDRKALPEPGAVTFDRTDVYEGPRNQDEELIAGIWEELLGIGKISVHDNFFALGGHSLLVTQLVSRLRKIFSLDFQVKSVFENPTITTQARLVHEKRLSQSGIVSPVIIPVSRDGGFVLSFSQQRLWFLEQLKPETPDYNIPTAFRIIGNLDEKGLIVCLETLINRHESLRMKIESNNGKPRLLVQPFMELPYRLVDLRNCVQDERRNVAERILVGESQTPFQISTGPLVRFLNIQLDENEYTFLLTVHHIISDGWSATIFFNELAFLYDAYTRGESVDLEPLPLQYVDYAAWQREWLQGEVLERELSYWKNQLVDIPQVLEIPTDFSRPAVQSGKGDFISFDFPPEMIRLIEEQCKNEGVTLFMYLLAAFSILLYRYSDQTDFCIGTPLANRDTQDIEGIIGFFVNTIVLRTDLSENPTFVELLSRVRATAMDAFNHSIVPFEMVVNAIEPVRDLSFSPLFQVMFTLQEQKKATGKSSHTPIHLEPLDVHVGISQFDLTLSMVKADDLLTGALEYCSDLFRPETIQRMISHFRILLEGLARNPEKRIHEFSLISEHEWDTITNQWNRVSSEFPDLCLHELFKQQVAKTPNRIAVLIALSNEQERLTYLDLDERSTQLALYLGQIGVEPNTVVGLCLERTENLYIGIMGILKAGGAYLPLDPTYPQERLEFMISDSNVGVIISQQNYRDFLESFPVRVVFADSGWGEIRTSVLHLNQDDLPAVSPELPAYVIYTSGSTGTPKGVAVSHRSVVNHNLAVKKIYQISEIDRVLQFSTLNFDAAVEEIFPTWLSGAALVIPPLYMITRGSLLITGKELTHLANIENITVLNFSTAFWHEWVHELVMTSILPKSVRLVIVGGEKARRDLYDQWIDVTENKIVWLNTYGPTEATVVATVFTPDGSLLPGQEIPIGKPIDNLRTYILDRDHKPVPIGLPGELFLGGRGVAIGYLNKPELNAKKFVPDPFIPNARMYKTGDKVRWLSDGNIEFMGRFDSQVKIRGFRIEINEIETQLLNIPFVRDAVVMPERKSKEQSSSGMTLIAYLVLDQMIARPDTEIRNQLRTKLPEYMIPSVFRFLSHLPRTPNGKIDRYSLDEYVIKVVTTPSEPFSLSEKEKKLITLWQEILGVKNIGPDDNFFEIGGDSILSIQLVAKANQAGIKFTVQQLFEGQTIRNLAVVAEEGGIELHEQGLVSGTFPMTPIQHWFFEQNFEQPWHWNQSLVLRVNQQLKVDFLNEVIKALTSHHDALRLNFSLDEQNSWSVDNLLDQEPIPFSNINLAVSSPSEAKEKFETNACSIQEHLGTISKYLFHVAYFNFGENETPRLLIVFHHLLVDGISWRILIEDIWTGYQQLLQGQEIIFPNKTTSYKDWALKLNKYALSLNSEEELRLWKEMSGGESIPFPRDFPNGENVESSTESINVQLSQTDTAKLLSDLPAVWGTEINDVLLAGLSLAIQRTTGMEEILIALESHGREDIGYSLDISRTVGWFTSFYPVKLIASYGMKPDDVLKSTKEILRKIPLNGLHYNLLRYSVDSSKLILSQVSQPDISFNYLGQVDRGFNEDLPIEVGDDSIGPSRGPQNKRQYLLDINGGIYNGELSLEISYSRNIHKKFTIMTFADNYSNALSEIISVTENSTMSVYTPSDFSLANLDQEKLNKLLTKVNQKKRVNS
jgi:amino acid adenylation domain-containing protein/non-ribosomal peptide synthase protein (TIGR01720 family)